jgi:hypothetical protein
MMEKARRRALTQRAETALRVPTSTAHNDGCAMHETDARGALFVPNVEVSGDCGRTICICRSRKPRAANAACCDLCVVVLLLGRSTTIHAKM